MRQHVSIQCGSSALHMPHKLMDQKCIYTFFHTQKPPFTLFFHTQMFVWVLENTLEKYFQCLVMRVKAFFQKIFSYVWLPNVKHFTGKMSNKYTYNTIEHLKIPLHIIYAHPLIPITKNINIYTSKFYITITEVPTYKNQRST